LSGLNLSVLQGTFSVCRLESGEDLPTWATQGELFSLSRSDEELSIVCESRFVPAAIQAEHGWRALKVEGPLDFSLTGILASLLNPLANEGVSIFAISTFDTDYLLLRPEALASAMQILQKSGHTIKD
jgi:hypothetical protein